MLKFLTHKLKTHSLNEDIPQKVEDEDHDSGTESDDEHGTGDEPEMSMESEGGSSVVTGSTRSRSSVETPAASPYFLDSALPSDCDQGYDQHSSEEELEVINFTQPKLNTGQEKRKWSQRLIERNQIAAILKNKEATRQWTRFKEDHEKLISSLRFFSKEIRHTVMVPVGPKALMKGSLVHTNEVLIALGDCYFVKDSAEKAIEVCQRRMQRCEEMLEKLEKERRLLESWQDISSDQNVFGSEDRRDIIEPYDDEKEKEWRQEHRAKEKEYRQKLVEVRDKAKNVEIKTEEDLWLHLDALELQEELEDELNRLEGGPVEEDINEEEEEEEENEEEDEEEEEEEDEWPENKEKVCLELKSESKPEMKVVSGVEKTTTSKKSVTFAEPPNEQGSTDGVENTIRIEFRHSDVEPIFADTGAHSITSPRDIYRVLGKCTDKKAKPIVKKTGSKLINPLGDIVERSNLPLPQEQKTERPVSKFKRERNK